MIYFVNPIRNPNVGDVAIYYTSSWFFRHNNLEYRIVNQTNAAYVNVQPTDIVALCGGGWMGIYDDSLMDFFYDIIEKYSKIAKVILMPCSFEPLKESFKRITNCKCVIFARDYHSFENFKKYFVNADVHFCNDMAFMLPKAKIMKSITDLDKSDIGIYDRNDAESSSIIKMLLPYGISEGRLNAFVDMDYNINASLEYVSRQLYTMNKYKLIVTDTLHMSIFAFCLKIPCIYLDNNYGKLSHTWSNYNTRMVLPYNSEYMLDTSHYGFTDEYTVQFNYYNLLQAFTRMN